MTEQTAQLQNYLDIIKRRRWCIVVPAAIVFAIALTLAVFLPAIYKSSATILIEEPDVPRELVTSMVTGYADQRLQVINQIVMSSQNLTGIITKYDLFAHARRLLPLSELIEKMRKDIGMEMVSAQVLDPRSGHPSQANIAFKVSFEHGRPEVAQRVANELVTLYLSENTRSRREKAAEATQFLAAEADRMEKQIADLQARLSKIKEANPGSLPEQMEMTMRGIDRSESDLRTLDLQAQTLKDREALLQLQLTQTNPYSSYSYDGKPVVSPAEQLKARRATLATVMANYGPDHPDVMRLRREIAALEKETGGADEGSALAKEAERLHAELTKAQERYAADHPDVVRLQRRLDETTAALQKLPARKPVAKTTAASPDNPIYLQLQGQLEQVRSEQRMIVDQRAYLRTHLAELEKTASRAPGVEQETVQVARALQAAVAEYNEVRRKQKAAEMGEALETERKAERLSLIEPPSFPNEPVKPNRPLIMLAGLVLGLGAGFGTALLADMLDHTVRNAKHLAQLTGVAPMVVVPYIRTREQARRAWALRGLAAFSVLCVVGGVLAYLHYRYAPLDVLWADVQRRLQTMLILNRG